MIILTEVLGVRVQACFGLVVQEKGVHADLLHQQGSRRQLVLSQLDHLDLLVEHRELAEVHVRLHPAEALEAGVAGSLTEPLLESSCEHFNLIITIMATNSLFAI